MRTVVGVLVAGLATSVAHAQPAQGGRSAAQVLYTEGQKRYEAGDYVGAAARFEAAYKLDADPVYLFNIAQAYRLGNQCAKAASYYREFLGAVPSAPNRAKVEQYIAQTDACAGEATTTTPLSPQPPVVDAPPQPPAPADHGATSLRRPLGIGALVIGGVGVAAGVFFTKRVGDLESEREALCAGATQEAPCEWADVAARAAALEQDGKAASRRAVLSYSLGGAALIGGAVLLLLGRSSERTSRVTLVPTADGAMAVGAFAF